LENFPGRFSSDICPIFTEIPDITLTAVKFTDISRFNKQVVYVCYSTTNAEMHTRLVESFKFLQTEKEKFS